MSTRNAKIVVILSLLGAAAIVACGSGSGDVITLGQPYENHPGDFAKPGVSNQDPPPTNTLATAADAAATGQGASGGTSGTTSGGTSGNTSGGTSGGTSGATSGGTSGSTGGCPPCDGNFSCDITLTGGMTSRMTVPLQTKNGACVVNSTSTQVTFACGGALTSQGSNVGTWANCSKATTTTPPDAG
ncbi:MAG: hypothetical protein QOI41_5025 [Myxococcales bacterium]|nr:hypothetical protein [Myxococcales bacterium]